MPVINPGEVWMIDFGMAAKIRPALILTGTPADDELDLVTVLLHTTALRGNQWELSIPKAFLKPGAFHLQQIQTISTVKLERRLGVLTDDEMKRVREALAKRLTLDQLHAATSVSEKDVPFHVVTLEHLIALKLRAWRYKDRLHINHLLDSEVAVDEASLLLILQRHSLGLRWQQLLKERA